MFAPYVGSRDYHQWEVQLIAEGLWKLNAHKQMHMATFHSVINIWWLFLTFNISLFRDLWSKKGGNIIFVAESTSLDNKGITRKKC